MRQKVERKNEYKWFDTYVHSLLRPLLTYHLILVKEVRWLMVVFYLHVGEVILLHILYRSFYIGEEPNILMMQAVSQHHNS